MRQLGRYQIVAELGRGAMGAVYKAIDPALDRPVAVKTIHFIADSAERAEYEARFQQEARAAGRLNHPNIVTVYDMGRDGDVIYIAMELLEGEDLRGLLERVRPPVRLAVDIVAQVADGLAFAHDYDVVHRDIKPENIMLTRNGPVKITNFGIARLRLSDVRTTAELLLGSPRYMAPEQIAERRVDHRADIFALGVVLYEALTGATPFAGDDLDAILDQIANAMPLAPSVANAALPPMLDLVVAKALAKDPEARYQTGREMAADLRSCIGEA
jgi:serine/threonine protein kinase